MRKISLLLLFLFCSPLAMGKVINVEFQFTPYTGDATNSDQVETVSGKALVFINNVLLAEQEVTQKTVPVLFEEREIAASVWVPVAGLGPRLRNGKNKIRIEFEPANTKAPYNAQFRWASVTDQKTEVENQDGRYRSTNQSDEGAETKQSTGKVVFEREFTADFATDRPWHHYAAVTTLTDEDKQRIATLIKDRANAFKPNFAAFYKLLKENEALPVEQIQKAKCVDKGYAAGIRISAPSADQLEVITTGNSEVVVQRKGGPLFDLGDRKFFERIKSENMQMCLGTAVYVAYPPRLAVVRMPSGEWQVVY